jgi:hypothetical protein
MISTARLHGSCSLVISSRDSTEAGSVIDEHRWRGKNDDENPHMQEPQPSFCMCRPGCCHVLRFDRVSTRHTLHELVSSSSPTLAFCPLCRPHAVCQVFYGRLVQHQVYSLKISSGVVHAIASAPHNPDRYSCSLVRISRTECNRCRSPFLGSIDPAKGYTLSRSAQPSTSPRTAPSTSTPREPRV